MDLGLLSGGRGGGQSKLRQMCAEACQAVNMEGPRQAPLSENRAAGTLGNTYWGQYPFVTALVLTWWLRWRTKVLITCHWGHAAAQLPQTAWEMLLLWEDKPQKKVLSGHRKPTWCILLVLLAKGTDTQPHISGYRGHWAPVKWGRSLLVLCQLPVQVK